MAVVKTAIERPSSEPAQIQATAEEKLHDAGTGMTAVHDRASVAVAGVVTASQSAAGKNLEDKAASSQVAAVSKTDLIRTSRGALEKPVMPEIRSSKEATAPQGPTGGGTEKPKPVAFEISVEELKPQKTSTPKSSLPKLELSEEEIKAKLSLSEERWRDLEKEKETRRSARSLAAAAAAAERSGSAKSNPEELKSKLVEKEAKVEQNRQRELAKRQSEQQKRDHRAKEVQRRKQELQKNREEKQEGGEKEEDLDLSWGGEAKDDDSDARSQ